MKTPVTWFAITQFCDHDSKVLASSCKYLCLKGIKIFFLTDYQMVCGLSSVIKDSIYYIIPRILPCVKSAEISRVGTENRALWK